MKRFRFALKKVHRLRRHQERAARLNMAEELSKLAELLTKRAHAANNLAVCQDAASRGQGEMLAQALERGLEGLLRRLGESIDAAEARVETAREMFQERRRDLLTMDKLHEGRLTAWKRDIEKDEQAEFDEMARLRYVVATKRKR